MDSGAPAAAETTAPGDGETQHSKNPKGKGKGKGNQPKPPSAKAKAKSPKKAALDLVAKGALAVVDAGSLYEQCIQGNVWLDSTASDSEAR